MTSLPLGGIRSSQCEIPVSSAWSDALIVDDIMGFGGHERKTKERATKEIDF